MSSLQAISSTLSSKTSQIVNKSGHQILIRIRDLLKARRGATIIDYIPSHLTDPIKNQASSRGKQLDYRHQNNKICDQLATSAHSKGKMLSIETLLNPTISLKDNASNQIIQENIGKTVRRIFNQRHWSNLSTSNQGKLFQNAKNPIEDDLYNTPNRLLIKYHLKLRTFSLPVNHIKSKFSYHKSKYTSTTCPICQDPEETLEHYLFKCKPLYSLRLANIQGTKSEIFSHLNGHYKALHRATQELQQLEQDLLTLHTSNDIPTLKWLNLISFLSGLLSSNTLKTIKNIYVESLKTRKTGPNSLKTTWNYKNAKQKFHSLLQFIRYKEYECWKKRIAISKQQV